MQNYEQKNKRRTLIKDIVIGGGLTAAFLGRRQIASGVMRLGSSLLGRFGARDTELATYAVNRSVSRMKWLTERNGIRDLAIQQVAEQRIRRSLVDDVGWGAEHAAELFSSKNRVNTWTAELLSGDHSMLARQGYANLRHRLGKPTGQIYDDIQRARSNAGLTGLYDTVVGKDGRKFFATDLHGGQLRQQVSQAQAAVEREYLRQLKERSHPATFRRSVTGRGNWLDWAANKSGAHRITFGSLGSVEGRLEKESFATLGRSREYLEKLAARHSDIGLDVSRVQIEGLWRTADGQITDLRGLSGMLGRWSEHAKNHFQIPIIPYMRGFSPAAMFPWIGTGTKDAVSLLSYKNIGKQLGAADRIAGREMNVALVGKSAIGMQFGEGVTSTAEVLGRDFVGLDVRNGFNKRLLSTLYGAKEARKAGYPKSFRDWLGKQPEAGAWGKAKSVVGKYHWDGNGEPYPAEALRALFAGEAVAENSPEAISSIASFLRNSGHLRQDIVRKVLVPNDAIDKDLVNAIGRGSTDDEVINYFKKKAASAKFSPVSENLSKLVHRFDNTQGAFRDTLHPVRSRNLVDLNFTGEKDFRRGIDLMRDSMYEEYLLNFPLTEIQNGGSVFERINALTGLNEQEKQEALSFVQGTFLQNQIRQQGFEAARDSLRTVTGLRENAEYMSDHYLSILDTHLPLPGASDLPHTFLVHEHASVLGQINRSLKEGRGPIGAAHDLFTSPASRQYTRASIFGMEEPENWTTSSIPIYFMQERMNRALSEVGLGLGPADLSSAYTIARGFALKRALPAFVGFEAYNYWNFEADQNSLIPSPKKLVANVRANLSLARSWVFGSDHWDQLYPGLSDSVFGTVFNGSNTYEEQKEQLRSGYVPVKSNKFWLFGSRSEFMGEKTRYYLPDPFQRAYSGWESAENADYSSKDYWAHSVLPTPRYPFSPISHFLDPYWWEKKHSTGADADRPYVKSGPLFSPGTPWGPFLNSTVGALLKPERTLYPQYDPATAKPGRGGASGAGPGGGYATLRLGAGSEEAIDPADAAYTANAEDDGREAGFALYPGSIARFKPAGGVSVEGIPAAGVGNSHGIRSARYLLSRINATLKTQGSHTTPLRISGGGANATGSAWNPESVTYSNPAEDLYGSVKDQMGIYGWLLETATEERPTGLRMSDASYGYGLSTRAWELNIGGIGGEVSEIGRRFLRKRPGTLDYFNPVPNSFYGSWLPGDGSYINLQRGDPYAKIPQGAMRLPGEAYERLHGVKLMQTRASSLGKSEDELIAEMLHMKEPLSGKAEQIVDAGTELHEAIQAAWGARGLLKAAETEIYDDKLGASGHIDALLEINGKRGIGEIKTMSAKRFRTNKPYSEHLDQLNFYLHITGLRSGILVYADRDNPGQIKTFNVNYSPLREMLVERKVARARAAVESMVAQGKVSRAQLYDDPTRLEILADVAPYSDEYRALASSLAGDDQLSEAQHARIQAAKKRAGTQKKTVDISPYHFSAGDELSGGSGIVNRIIDPNTLQLVGGRVIRLAGVKASGERIENYFSEHSEGVVNDLSSALGEAVDKLTGGSWGEAHLGKDRAPAAKMFAKFGIFPGSPIAYEYSADESERTGDDMYKSLRVVLRSGPTNVNQALLKMGIAVERENDWSAAGVEARFSGFERLKGGLWEKLAHLDTPFNTKFLRVRSAYEEYVRGNVYGSNSGSWEHPVRDYILPTIDSYVVRNPILAGLSLGAFASMFTPTKSAKLKVGTYAAATGAALSLATHAREIISQKPWIPSRTRKRRDIEEYYDILNYIKYKGLYEHAAQMAESKEHTDIEKLVSTQEKLGKARNKSRRLANSKKAELKAAGGDDAKEQIALLNQKTKRIQAYEKDVKLGPWGTQALLYRQKYQSTLYGIAESPTGDYKSLMRALPKYEREVIAGVLKDSTPEEKRKFYRLLPDNEKRVLGKKLGATDIPKPESLPAYFKRHTLPDPNWQGWLPNVDLNMLKARTVAYEGLDPMDLKLYPQTIAQAEAVTQEIEVPTVNGHSAGITKTLKAVMSGHGLKNTRVMVQVIPDANAKADSVSVDMNVSYDRHADLVSALRNG